jgi:hypothetical protein
MPKLHLFVLLRNIYIDSFFNQTYKDIGIILIADDSADKINEFKIYFIGM